MNAFPYSVACVLLLFPAQLLAASPVTFDLTYPGAKAKGKFKTEPYDKLEFLVKVKGYVPYYGETHSQRYTYPKFTDDSYKTVSVQITPSSQKSEIMFKFAEIPNGGEHERDEKRQSICQREFLAKPF